MRYVVSIDQGTTGSTVLVVDEHLKVVGRDTREFRQIYPKPGWVEHDPDEIWKSVCEALSKAIAQADIAPNHIAAIGIANQRETAVLWERQDLRPARTAIVWQDRRTADLCRQLKEAGKEEVIRRTTGLVIDPYFSGSKLWWMLDDDSNLRKRAEHGEIAFGTVDSYLVAKLTKGAVHVTDVSNASRTMLFGLHSLDWEQHLLDLFHVPREVLPSVRSSSEVYGTTRGVPGLPDGIPVAGIAGDQQAALFGQACFAAGETKCTYGTGAFILMNTGTQPVPSHNGLLTTIGWQVFGEVTYALEGSAFIAGAAVQWLRDGLGVIQSAAEIETLATSVESSQGVVLVPAFAGLGAPHWRPNARGIITGLTQGTGKAHLARAALEAIALQNYDILKAMEEDSGRTLTSLKVDGGVAANNLLMQFQADVLNTDIDRPKLLEMTALGSAFLAGLGVGLWKNKEQVAAAWHKDRAFRPTHDRAAVEEHLRRWNRAVAQA